MRKRFAFDRRAAIAAAWDFLWADNLKRRAEDEAEFKKTGRQPYRANETYYLTASDVEAQVRQFAEETVKGKPWGSMGRAYGRSPYSSIRLSGNLLSDVRDWLRRNSKLASHNFGRGHISGMRYRPAGEPISETETKTIADKQARRDRPRPVHFGRYGAESLCVAEARKKRGRRFSLSRSRTRNTDKREKVTCVRCLNLMKAECVAV